MKCKSIIVIFNILLLVTIGYSQGDNKNEKILGKPSKKPRPVTNLTVSRSSRFIKDSPFSAEGVSESIQKLHDGNRIVKKSTVKMFRDSKGRFRQEGSGRIVQLSGYFLYNSFYGTRNAIYVYDPVKSIRYVLNPEKKTAHRFKLYSSSIKSVKELQKRAENLKKSTKGSKSYNKLVTTLYGNTIAVSTSNNNKKRERKTESLGTKTIEGVKAEGTKTTTTIPAGAIGNEKPIESVYERWYSKELGLTVYSRNYDPRYGEQTYRLVNISRKEQDISLFTVSSDYKIVDGYSLAYKNYFEKNRKNSIEKQK